LIHRAIVHFRQYGAAALSVPQLEQRRSLKPCWAQVASFYMSSYGRLLRSLDTRSVDALAK
jgi:hypothetical protein